MGRLPGQTLNTSRPKQHAQGPPNDAERPTTTPAQAKMALLRKPPSYKYPHPNMPPSHGEKAMLHMTPHMSAKRGYTLRPRFPCLNLTAVCCKPPTAFSPLSTSATMISLRSRRKSRRRQLKRQLHNRRSELGTSLWISEHCDPKEEGPG